jgi:hypothetical protein
VRLFLLPTVTVLHLNPIRTRQFKAANVQQRSEYLKAYPWSSFAGYCYLRKRNQMIDYGWLLSTYYGADSGKARRRYRQYVVDAIGAEIENPFEEVVHQSVLGTEAFVAWVKQKLPQKGQREIPSLKKLHRHLSVENIIGQVAKAGNAAGEDLGDRKTPHKVLRQIAMEFSYR